ncbi:TPA: DNA replication protein DnaC [Enterobacter cloacae]|uniref:DNA replication protein DnaC n=1 Tax=Enterobacter cloacae TaxID=550 RepID=UPI000B8D1A00|nr:DNA replication protein DnaC [Enterobacter cloacae]OXU34990.1 DNA replication protein DnaC [Enterobacter cloacae subsp. cloacae]HDC4405012.1 DNA replication protein DnaC [Enterobacter cloacae]HDC4599192.1 DNA replication protein DnaC [Enterobacter cloacae]
MKNVSSLMNRLKKIIPEGIEPRFKNSEELMAWQQEEGRKRSEFIARENIAKSMERSFGRSGIRTLHQGCSFENYKATTTNQKIVREKARLYAVDFDKSMGGFIFCGNPGTGKNHLAAAICNDLLRRGKTVLIITVADIMSSMRETFNGTSADSEEKLIDKLSSVDLLVIDEIGVQNESRYEKVIINQIIDRRTSSRRPTGLLSNLDEAGLNRQLGERVMDRMKLGGTLWLNFDWESYRENVR